MYSSQKKSGFTLIELLIVIAIIAILASILFPVFGRARENARRSSCSSNLKQIGLGVQQYTQDYDERYPMKNQATDVRWNQAIQPYVKATQLFACPSNPLNKTNNANANGSYPAIPTSYAPNSRFIDADYGHSLAEANEPTIKILVGEIAQETWHDFGSSWWDNATTFSDALTGSGFAGHLGTSNYLFADGHVKALKPTATMTPINMYGAFGGGCCNSINYTVNDNTPVALPLSSLGAAQAKWQ
ncbi:MAG TPA: DUF1559 domain-containing protein [Abditibacteriaceae bacterium]|jgi:prepilin-type N-terminal cleavage/methylation domain-containing protein/prepilin-type processing-associated H-X9-DG protein